MIADTGRVGFRIDVYSRRVPNRNPLIGLGFRFFGRHTELGFYDHALRRLLGLLKGRPFRPLLVRTGWAPHPVVSNRCGTCAWPSGSRTRGGDGHPTAGTPTMHDLFDQGYVPLMSFQVTDVEKALKGADYPLKGGPNEVMKELKGQLGGEA